MPHEERNCEYFISKMIELYRVDKYKRINETMNKRRGADKRMNGMY